MTTLDSKEAEQITELYAYSYTDSKQKITLGASILSAL